MYKYEEDEAKDRIAEFIAKEFEAASKKHPLYVNLGVGIPTKVADHLKPGAEIYLEAENGMLGVGPAAKPEEADPLLINAGRVKVTETPGCSYMSSVDSFGIIRGGHVDATVIGAFEVDENGDLANWIVPNGKQLGVGGAMDLVSGARKVYIAMQHCNKKGKAKIIEKCTLPLTGVGVVDVIVTEYAVFRFLKGKMFLTAISDNISLEELKSITPANYTVSDKLSTF
ncbi:MAG: 3-oxoacid CoA-transferase subunit B [Acidaminococcaceae bacterium]|nr:3-oxoacid CoA-transferase subunit B [Acidaminococcaceae bacterium]